MNLEKLFGSKTKIDILKYLIFRRQGVSMRALETEIWWTFPAIKKQVDALQEADILEVIKDPAGRSISMKPDFSPVLKQLFFLALQQELIKKFQTYPELEQYFWWDKFWKAIGMDVILIYQDMDKLKIEQLKHEISEIFRTYWIESVSVVFMSAEERDKRYRLADRFVLQVMRYYNTQSN